MTHTDAVEQMMVERYLLGDLTGDARSQFEDHLFDCAECAADLKQGVLFLDGARLELKSAQKAAAPALPVAVQRKPSRFAAVWRPWVLAPALAASLAVIVYQSAIVMPRLKADAQVAQVQTPAVLKTLVLANAGARGDSTATLTAPRHGAYLLSVDIPPSPGALGYRCSLYSPAGALIWHVDVSSLEARDAVTIEVPVSASSDGVNELRVQAISSSSSQPGSDTLVDLTSYRYTLKFEK